MPIKFALAAVMLVSCRAFAGAGLDRAAYQIERANSTVKTNHAPQHWTEWQNFLVFSSSNTRIPLARSADAWWDGLDEHENWGFDPASLKLEWLREGRLLWICWETYGHGSGRYINEAHVLVRIENGQTSELFRDSFLSVARGGWAAQTYVSLQIAYKEYPETIMFTRSTTDINGGEGLPSPDYPCPFTTVFTNDSSQVSYISDVHTVDTWDYKLAGDKLKFLRGNQSILIGDETKPVSEVTRGFHVTRAALERMNPTLRGHREANGIVVVNQGLKEYEPTASDGLDDGE